MTETAAPTMSIESARAILREQIREGAVVYLVERRRSRTDLTVVIDLKVIVRGGTRTGRAGPFGQNTLITFLGPPAILSIGATVAAGYGLTYHDALRGAIFRKPMTPEILIALVSRDLFEGRRDALSTEWL